jgi:multisubunit Na+/H+ antiporter MnhC subunit
LQDEKSFTSGPGGQVSNNTQPGNSDQSKKQQKNASAAQHPIAQAMVLIALLIASIQLF